MTRIAVALVFFAAVLAVLTFSAQCREQIMGKGEQDGVLEGIGSRVSGRLVPQDGYGGGVQLSQPITGGFLPLLWKRTTCRTCQTGKGGHELSGQLLGYFRPGPVPHTIEHRVRRLSGAVAPASSLPEPSGRLLVLLDLTMVYVDSEFAETQASVTFQESTWRCEAYRTTEVEGIIYEVFGLFQLLYDSSMQRLTESMSYTKEDLLKCAPNALVAEAWYHLTNNGVPWRLWVAKPQYRNDGTSGEY